LADGRIAFRNVHADFAESGDDLVTPAGPVRVAFGPDNSEVVAGAGDGTVIRYLDGEEARRWNLNSEILAIAVGQNGTIGAVTKNAVHILGETDDVMLGMDEMVKPVGCWWNPVTGCLTVAGNTTNVKWIKYPNGQYKEFLG
jgi:hypothetical protein